MLGEMLKRINKNIKDVKLTVITIRKTGNSRKSYGEEWYEYEASCRIVMKNGQHAESKRIRSWWLEKEKKLTYPEFDGGLLFKMRKALRGITQDKDSHL